jgi:hypothetical protein
MEKETYWIIKNGEPVKVSFEEWLEWKYRQDNINLNY